MGTERSAATAAWGIRRRYFPAVEGMRGVAVLCVMCGHILLTGYPGGPIHTFAGWLAPFGVVIFFGISGFLLYRQFLAARFAGDSVGAATPSYLWRRAVRIFPAYWVALTLGTVWVGWYGAFTGHWWVFYGLLQSYNPSWLPEGLPIAWSLVIEASFYLVLPFIALGLARRGLGSGNRHALRWELGVLGGLAVVGLLWRTVMAQVDSDLNANLLGTIVWFSSGMLLAAIQVAHPASLAGLRRLLSSAVFCWPAAVALFAANALGISEIPGMPTMAGAMLETALYGGAAALLLAPAVLAESDRVVHRLMAGRAIVFIGTISYGIYLWHYTVLAWLDFSPVVLTARFPELTLASLVIGITLVLATASWYLVEKPLMRRAKSVKAFRHVKRGEIEVARDDGPAAEAGGPAAPVPAGPPEPAPNLTG
jgi:peptidoglycan/LPS O-acetylase OafA/YrhL